MAKYTLGQEVIVTTPNRVGEPFSTVISRVGRKFVYIEQYGRERKFFAESGAEDAGGYIGGAIYRPDEWADREARTALLATLRALGVELRNARDISIAQLSAITDILAGSDQS